MRMLRQRSAARINAAYITPQNGCWIHLGGNSKNIMP